MTLCLTRDAQRATVSGCSLRAVDGAGAKDKEAAFELLRVSV